MFKLIYLDNVYEMEYFIHSFDKELKLHGKQPNILLSELNIPEYKKCSYLAMSSSLDIGGLLMHDHND